MLKINKGQKYFPLLLEQFREIGEDLGDEVAQSNFLLYTGNDGKVNIEVFLQDETIWLTQKAISELYGAQRPAITKHLKNIFDSGELQEDSVCAIFAHTASGELEEKSNVQKMRFSHSDKRIKSRI